MINQEESQDSYRKIGILVNISLITVYLLCVTHVFSVFGNLIVMDFDSS